MASETRPLAPGAAMPPRPSPPRVDADGVKTFKTPASRKMIWLVVLAVAVPIAATIVAVAVIRLAPGRDGGGARPRAGRDHAAEPIDDSGPARPAPVNAPAAPHVDKLVAKRIARTESTAPAVADAAEKRPRKKRPEIGAAEAITALREEGETGGIAAFPLPGTKPVKSGIVVPEEFELPEGYVRHYQTTDDGKQLPAILMFHPDYQFVDEHGAPVAVPDDRIVPPSMAPPGLRPEMLDVSGEGGGSESPR